ncbi:hypothetical protein LQF12_00575 [Ruania suaedae]|uniref:hypothetical protein n=1 Tax=Ruania suaedae TaxID=2897774 RepID=UPI001E2E8B62|nr:hypothetical protein [Ruania suaedae]UFU03143.1 hypothetical protein LQF12_00575 [Ruania suaedae]
MSTDPGHEPADSTARAATRARRAALQVAGVADLHSGRFAEIRTYLAGSTVPGVRVEAGAVHVHTVLLPGSDLPLVAGEVHDAVAAATGRPVVVHVDDVTTSDNPLRSTP